MSNIFPRSLPASLARRLAEAADGFRNAGQVFFIAGYQLPHPVKNFPDLTSAQQYFYDKGLLENDFAIFGPYNTIDEVHDLKITNVQEIAKVDMTIHFKDGSKQHMALKGAIDSIFFNLSSFDKFVFPYYCHVYDAVYAKNLRDKLIAQYKKFAKSKLKNQHAMRLPPARPHAALTYLLALNEEALV